MSPKCWSRLGAAAVLLMAWIGGALKFEPPSPAVPQRQAPSPSLSATITQNSATPKRARPQPQRARAPESSATL